MNNLAIRLSEITRTLLKHIYNRLENHQMSPKQEIDLYYPDFSKIEYKNGKIYFFKELFEDLFLFMYKKNVERPVWILHGFSYQNYLNKIPNLLEFSKELKERYNVEDIVLDKLFYHAVKVLEDYPDSFETKIVDILQELSGQTPLWTIKLFLNGIWLEENKISISNWIHIRRIKDSDFVFYSEREGYSEFVDRKNIPSVVLVIRSSVNSEDDAKKEANIISTAFLLLKLGSVFHHKLMIQNNSFINPISSEKKNPIQIFDNKIYTFKKTDILSIVELIASTRNIIGNEESNYLTIALHHYRSAFLNIDGIPNQITYACSCLESLLSNKGEIISRVLKERTSIILSFFGFNSLSIAKIVNEAYKIRSNYSHSNPVSYNYDKLNKISIQILECNRIILQIFFQIEPLINDVKMLRSFITDKSIKEKRDRTILRERKRWLLKLVDEALLHKRTYNKLQKKLKSNIKIFLN